MTTPGFHRHRSVIARNGGPVPVRVAVRLRPFLDKAQQEKGSTVRGLGEKALEICNWRNNQESLKYEFDAFYDEDTSQDKIFTTSVQNLLEHTLHGQNASVFAYGPTGAGKTHTMVGTSEDPGIIPRSVHGVLNAVARERGAGDGEWAYSIAVSYLEIYQEKVHDLLETKNRDLQIREDRDRNILIPGLSEKIITDFQQFEKHFVPASQNRTTASTKLNSRSSRSHSILLLKVVKTQQVSPFRQLTGKLYLIDLAGSEDNRKTGNQGIRLKESGAINTSLFVLGQVVDALNSGQARVPYRDSKLTRLLQDSVGGTSHACMIVNLAPEESFYTDTYTTLNFAAKSKQIVNRPFTRESIVRPHVLKRPADSATDGASKRVRIEEPCTPTTPAMVQTPAKLPAPFLSPLLRRQDKFETSMVDRLEKLETAILARMRRESVLTTANRASVCGTPGQSREVLLQKLEDSRKQLRELKEQQEQQKAAAETAKENEQPLCQQLTSDVLFKHSTSFIRRKKVAETEKPKAMVSPVQAGPLKPLNMDQDSPDIQFVRIIKPKDTVKTKKEGGKGSGKWQLETNPELQEKHAAGVLDVLNSGKLKKLTSLQCVGDKRARLILGWWQMNGPFKQVEDLKAIPGLPSKTVDNIIKGNLLCFGMSS
ncbi:kinesin-like protein KIF22 [Branchiostoma floridae x Branchiostoma belcheri]